MLVPLGRRLLAMEAPILERHGVSMWGYAVLSRLGEEPPRTQAAFAESIGADKTRIIGVLDELQDRGLIDRRPDPADRRARLLSITPAGHRMQARVQREIQRNEERLLARLSRGDREAFLRALRILSDDQQA
jgi:DNA-binding MarR family transcriptional regulator